MSGDFLDATDMNIIGSQVLFDSGITSLDRSSLIIERVPSSCIPVWVSPSNTFAGVTSRDIGSSLWVSTAK